MIGIIFTIIFALEALLKIIGMGFILHKSSYLREGFNFIDFIIVIAGYFNRFMLILYL